MESLLAWFASEAIHSCLYDLPALCAGFSYELHYFYLKPMNACLVFMMRADGMEIWVLAITLLRINPGFEHGCFVVPGAARGKSLFALLRAYGME